MVAPRLAGSNTQTSARGMPGVVSCGSPAPGTLAMEGSVRCWPRCAVVMKARCGLPAKTMSRGSSPTSSVRTTCGVPVRLTMLTLSESRFVTHTSVLLRAATATGSRPTGTRIFEAGNPEVRSKTSSVPLGVLTANSVLPSGDMASGRTGPLSNSTNAGPVDAAEATCRPKNWRPASARPRSAARARGQRVIARSYREERADEGQISVHQYRGTGGGQLLTRRRGGAEGEARRTPGKAPRHRSQYISTGARVAGSF